MVKKILYFITGIILILVAFIGYRLSTFPTMIRPIAYQLPPLKTPKAQQIAAANVLIIGDQQAKKLEHYQLALSDVLSQDLSKAVTFHNMGSNLDGLHRTLAKIKAMPKLPPVVVYLGGSQEFIEKKFFVKDYENIKRNFKIFENPTFNTLIFTFPILSRLLYFKTNHIQLAPDVTPDTLNYPSPYSQKRLEIMIKYYQLELSELIETVQSRGSKLILMTNPLNLLVRPNKVCENSTSPTLDAEIQKVIKLAQNGQYKEAYNIVKELRYHGIGNAKILYLAGKTLIHLGEYVKAKETLEKANSFDCDPKNGLFVHNIIMKNLASQYHVSVIDFHDIVNQDLGRNTLFFDAVFPQNLYFQKALVPLIKKIKDYLEI